MSTRRGTLGIAVRPALRLAAAALAIGSLAIGSVRAQGAPPATVGFVEVTAAKDTFFVGEAIDVTIHAGIRADLADGGLVQLFRQPLDVPLRLTAAWLEELPDARRLGLPPAFAAVADRSAVVQHRPATLHAGPSLQRSGVEYRTFAWRQRLIAERPTELDLTDTRLAFRYATGFDEDFFGDRVPRDPRDVEFVAEPLRIRVVEPPTAGRPVDFGGAVGRFAIDAQRDGDGALTAGESFRVVVTIRGDGVLTGFDAPTLPTDSGLHRTGMIEDLAPGLRRITFDLVARRPAVTAVPSFELPFLDPGPPPTYRRIATAPIPIDVRPDPDAPPPAADAEPRPAEPAVAPPAVADATPPAPIPGVDELFGIRPVPSLAGDGGAPTVPSAEAGVRPRAVVLALLIPWLAAGLAVGLRRFAAGAPARRRRGRRRAAAGVFRRALAAGVAPDRALVDYLAVQLDRPAPMVVDPSLADRLATAGAPVALAERTAARLDDLGAPRYGGAPDPVDREALHRLVAELDACFAPHRAARPRTARAVLALAICAGWSTAGAQQAPPLDAAERAFARGDFAAASVIWQDALASGRFAPAPLCHNLGNAADALGRPADAVLWFRRALAFAPGDLRAAANLRLVERQLGLAQGGPAPLGVTWLDGLRARLAATPPGALLAIAILLQTVGALTLVLTRRRGLAGFALAVGIALAIAPVRGAFAERGPAAVVIRADARLMSEPHRDAVTRTVLPLGGAVEVLAGSDRWALVLRGADTGWTEQRNLERVFGSTGNDRSAR